MTQILHVIIHRGGLSHYLRDEDIIASLTSAMIHDFDHPGLNNSFQISSNSYLATLYNDRSILENHHCAQTFMIMRNQEGCNIFENIIRINYRLVTECQYNDAF